MTVFVDPDDTEEVLEHESYGMVSLHHISGSRRLFGVDYNTGHSTRLEIKTGRLERDGFREYFHADKTVALIELSEVQLARLISTPNTSGVPCTIRYACTEGFKQMEEPPEHMADAKKMVNDVESLGRRVSANMDHLRKKLDEAVSGKTPNKTELKELAKLAQQTQQAMEKDMPYLTQRMTEKVEESVSNGKAEVDAYITHQLTELGRAALGEKIRSGGVAIRIRGQKADLKQLSHGGEDDEERR